MHFVTCVRLITKCIDFKSLKRLCVEVTVKFGRSKSGRKSEFFDYLYCEYNSFVVVGILICTVILFFYWNILINKTVLRHIWDNPTVGKRSTVHSAAGPKSCVSCSANSPSNRRHTGERCASERALRVVTEPHVVSFRRFYRFLCIVHVRTAQLQLRQLAVKSNARPNVGTEIPQ